MTTSGLETETTSSSLPSSILVVRLDVQGDVLVATSVLPGLHAKYPDAVIDWYVRMGFDFALQNNPYIRHIIYGPRSDEQALLESYDKVIQIEHHDQWNRPMAWIHCDVAGVPHHKPELYFADWELDIEERYKSRILVSNNAGWRSRTCPNLSPVLCDIATPEFLQVDRGAKISSHIESIPLSLREVAAIMYHAKLYIGIDTVFMHMAAALEKPMVLFFGPTGPETQYVPNAVFLRPGVWLNPAEHNPAYGEGIPLEKEDILATIRSVLSEDGEIISSSSRPSST